MLFSDKTKLSNVFILVFLNYFYLYKFLTESDGK